MLSSTSSLWTMLIGSVFRIERISVMRVLAIASCLAGVGIITAVNPDDDSGPVSADLYWVGDIFAVMGAVCYGMYITMLKYRVPNHHALNPFLFFGLVGTWGDCRLYSVKVTRALTFHS